MATIGEVTRCVECTRPISASLRDFLAGASAQRDVRIISAAAMALEAVETLDRLLAGEER